MSSQQPSRYENHPPDPADAQGPTLSGSGKFNGKAARLLAQLRIDDTGAGKLATSILTAKPESGVTAEAEQIGAQLSEAF